MGPDLSNLGRRVEADYAAGGDPAAVAVSPISTIRARIRNCGSPPARRIRSCSTSARSRATPSADALPVDAGENHELVPGFRRQGSGFLSALAQEGSARARLAEFRPAKNRRRSLEFIHSLPSNFHTCLLPNQKPDLEDSINVTEAHGRVVREAAACAREKRIADNGIEPISLWASRRLRRGRCSIAGGILGGGGKLVRLRHDFPRGICPHSRSGRGGNRPPPKEALAAYMAKGAKIYSAKCNGCHGSDAKGNGSTFPSLVGSDLGHRRNRALCDDHPQRSRRARQQRQDLRRHAIRRESA